MKLPDGVQTTFVLTEVYDQFDLPEKFKYTDDRFIKFTLVLKALDGEMQGWREWVNLLFITDKNNCSADFQKYSRSDMLGFLTAFNVSKGELKSYLEDNVTDFDDPVQVYEAIKLLFLAFVGTGIFKGTIGIKKNGNRYIGYKEKITESEREKYLSIFKNLTDSYKAKTSGGGTKEADLPF